MAASISLVGDISRAEAEMIAEAIAAGLPKGEAAKLPAAPEKPKWSLTQLAHPASQAHVYIGLPAIERGNPDFFPLLVGNYTLGVKEQLIFPEIEYDKIDKLRGLAPHERSSRQTRLCLQRL